MEQANDGARIFSIPWKILIIITAGLVLLGWLLSTPPGLLGKADAIGYAVCHRIDGRSFHLGDRQLPLCARCSGMFLGALLGLGYQEVCRRRAIGTPPWKILIPLGVMVLVWLVDGFNSYLRLFLPEPLLYEPQNWLRLLTGTGMGLALSAALYPAFNQTVWGRVDKRPALDSLPSLGLLVLLALLLDLVVLSENPLLLYPLAILSALGVLVILSMTYALVWLMLFHGENRAQIPSHLIFPLLGGFVLAILQIAAFDAIRFAFTGTWSGFSF